MAKKGNYLGGSTVVQFGSTWFSRPEPGVDPVSGETRVERIRRLTSEMEKRIEQKKKNANSPKRKRQPPPLNDPQRRKKYEQRRLARIEKKRAEAAIKNELREGEPAGVEKQKAKMATVVVEKKRKKSLVVPKANLRK